jgi:hypothetical protein
VSPYQSCASSERPTVPALVSVHYKTDKQAQMTFDFYTITVGPESSSDTKSTTECPQNVHTSTRRRFINIGAIGKPEAPFELENSLLLAIDVITYI